MKNKIKIDPSKVIITEPMRWKEGGGGFELVALLLIMALIFHAFNAVSQ